MFEAIELGQTLDKQAFKDEVRQLRPELLDLQLQLREAGVATLIIVAGVDGGGKGEVVDRLYQWLDARGLETHAFWDATDEELQRPRDWRFWRRLPARGSIAIMFGGWYWRPIHGHARGELSDTELEEAGRQVGELEVMLQQDGLQLVKLWFHLSHDAHAARMKKRREVMAHIRKNHAAAKPIKYKRFVDSAEQMLRYTDSSQNPWLLIEADDPWFRDISVARALKATLEQCAHEQRRADRRKPVHAYEAQGENDRQLTVLDKVDLGCSLARKAYKGELEHYQEKLHALSWRAYDARQSTIIVFEGWDAAGKGGAIRRLTSAMDARLYHVISVGAPTEEELAHHYLWRFWRQVPRDGYMTLYDRSWYGRVLVERVEGLTEKAAWMRAYQEINAFEKQLVNHGTTLIKFWLHISQEEQLQRFRDRQRVAWKQYKITDEDWRNREQWEAYRQAVHDMVGHTSTSHAPWQLIPAENKHYARIEVLKQVCEGLEAALKDK